MLYNAARGSSPPPHGDVLLEPHPQRVFLVIPRVRKSTYRPRATEAFDRETAFDGFAAVH